MLHGVPGEQLAQYVYVGCFVVVIALLLLLLYASNRYDQ